MEPIKSNGGYFEITALSFSKNVIALGETVTMDVTIKNKIGANTGSTTDTKITNLLIFMYGWYLDENGEVGNTGSRYLCGTPNNYEKVSWNNEDLLTFSFPVNFSELHGKADKSSYVLDPADTNLSLYIQRKNDFPDGKPGMDAFDNLFGSEGEYVTVLSRRDNPKLSLAIERTPDDESENVAVSARLTADVDYSTLKNHEYSAKMYYGASANAINTELAFNASIAQLYNGITDSVSAITRSFSNGSDWYFMLQVSNDYETQSARVEVPRGWSNFHQSGKPTGGACFGGFGKSKLNKPMFESYYPGYFYAGFDQIGPAKPWTELPLASGVTVDTTYNAPLRYRVIEKHVFIEGIVRVAGANSAVMIAALPEAIKPSTRRFVMAPCEVSANGIARIARINVNPDDPTTGGGGLWLGSNWPRRLDTGAAATNEMWIDCAIDYWIN